ncbi:hypothetical protein ACL6C3_14325 [Capilliphycus salinus ALCB114379]|uniref:hypothetical protein n=1 Tax=Capilliphycus salinus TaxID=2768948 RepID=UPI0039A53D90
MKYALKELLKDKAADDILKLTVCEPAMGSAAFLNEAVDQLAEAYLERKQEELNQRIPHERVTLEKQKVKMFLADRNVFGIDKNPIAMELAEVSLWLNSIYGEPFVVGASAPSESALKPFVVGASAPLLMVRSSATTNLMVRSSATTNLMVRSSATTNLMVRSSATTSGFSFPGSVCNSTAGTLWWGRDGKFIAAKMLPEVKNKWRSGTNLTPCGYLWGKLYPMMVFFIFSWAIRVWQTIPIR